jgi:hypothetical protein
MLHKVGSKFLDMWIELVPSEAMKIITEAQK